MAIYEHLTRFAGKPVVDWSPGDPLANPERTVYRISLSWEDTEEGQAWSDRLGAFVSQPGAPSAAGLIVGNWGPMEEGGAARVVEALVAARERLSGLTALFFGEVLAEECEISWMVMGDVSPLFEAYPNLEHFRVRGTQGLTLGVIRHPRLKELGIESGGLPRAIIHDVFTSELPQLEHLELWLGDEGYGADSSVEDLAPLLSGRLFPRLRYLGLRDSEYTDEIAQVLVNAPVMERLRVLDLSLGTFGDEGAAALLAYPHLGRLEKLDLHHHFCSDEPVARLKAVGIEVDLSDPQTPDDWGGESHRYVAVGE
jgi:hypothetical protein